LSVYDDLKSTIVQELNNSVFTRKNFLKDQVVTDLDLTEERKLYFLNTIKENESNLQNLIFKNIHNPATLLSISKYFHNTQQFDFSLAVGKHDFKVLQNLRNVREEHDKIIKARDEFIQEEIELDKSVKRLDEKKKRGIKKTSSALKII